MSPIMDMCCCQSITITNNAFSVHLRIHSPLTKIIYYDKQ